MTSKWHLYKVHNILLMYNKSQQNHNVRLWIPELIDCNESDGMMQNLTYLHHVIYG